MTQAVLIVVMQLSTILLSFFTQELINHRSPLVDILLDNKKHLSIVTGILQFSRHRIPYIYKNLFMPFNRRKFLQRAGVVSATAFLSSIIKPAWSKNLEKAIRDAENMSPDQLASDEDFW